MLLYKILGIDAVLKVAIMLISPTFEKLKKIKY